MAMNKKELAYVESLKERLALCFTPEVAPDVPRPGVDDGLVIGYSFNAYSREVRKSCSSYLWHAVGSWDKTDAQGAIEQYSTRLLALRAMRNAIEMRCARDLRGIDIMIEQEKLFPMGTIGQI